MWETKVGEILPFYIQISDFCLVEEKMDTVKLRLRGGLGNQIFQYSAARLVQKMHDCPKLLIDTGEYDKYKVRNIELNSFLLNSETEFTNGDSLKTEIVRKAFRCYQKAYNVLTSKFSPMYEFNVGCDRYICSTVEFRNPTIENVRRMHLYGYFVSSEVAELMKPVLMKEMLLKLPHSEPYYCL